MSAPPGVAALPSVTTPAAVAPAASLPADSATAAETTAEVVAAPAGDAAARPAPKEAATQGAASGTYRVKADGVVGCDNPQALRLLRHLRATPAATPRLLAQAHRDGRCMTAFTTGTWTLERMEGDVVRLRFAGTLASGAPAALYFLREDVAAQTDAN